MLVYWSTGLLVYWSTGLLVHAAVNGSCYRLQSSLTCLVQKTSNLRVALLAKSLAVSVYRVSGRLPAAERYGLTSQMRRAAVSIGSNIAEGCGRSGDRSLVAFLQIAMGSASELEFQLELARELGMIAEPELSPVLSELQTVMRMLGKLMTSLREH